MDTKNKRTVLDISFKSFKTPEAAARAKQMAQAMATDVKASKEKLAQLCADLSTPFSALRSAVH
jgi:hypothetical protein